MAFSPATASQAAITSSCVNLPLPPLAFRPGEIEWLREGKVAILLSMGGIAREALSAAEKLSTLGVSAGVAAVAHSCG